MPELSAPLLVHLARRLQTEAEVELIAFGLRARHVIALTLLRDLGEQNQSDLSAMLGVDATNVVALLNELEAADLIERRRSTEDRRRHTVTLTPEGNDKLGEIEKVLSVVEQHVLAPLSDAERHDLYTLLARATAGQSCAEVLPTVQSCVTPSE
ncbi:MarR family winged helix-turn-helix transcriptional regulator [Mycolicibacterium tusciae]|uniref:MarR family winged helix-turn-helix transcriptional regulator n=1 Tax=Mycolicibacterium tusciae TaxID=75922 RepID=UPI00024A3A60|nr:MarR family winged helix-turn-helix transcriptional regulator [Mycolicibacterium tusciae]